MTIARIGLSILGLALLCAGCSAQGSDGEDQAPSEVGRVMQEVTLNEFEAGGQTVAFVAYTDAEAGTTIGLHETFSAFAKNTLSDRAVLAAGHPLTMLELFHALAPSGMQPHPALVDAHAAEALAMGRADSELDFTVIDVDAPVEKSVASCESWVYDVSGLAPGYTYLERGAKNNQTGYQTACLNNNCGHYTEGQTRAGTCNESDTVIKALASWGYRSVNGGAWLFTPSSGLGAHLATRWTLPFTSGNPKRMAAIGSSGGPHPYHLRTGVLFFVHP